MVVSKFLEFILFGFKLPLMVDFSSCIVKCKRSAAEECRKRQFVDVFVKFGRQIGAQHKFSVGREFFHPSPIEFWAENEVFSCKKTRRDRSQNGPEKHGEGQIEVQNLPSRKPAKQNPSEKAATKEKIAKEVSSEFKICLLHKIEMEK